MKFLTFLERIKQAPTPLHLVDIALILAILPHLDHLKFPMLVYTFLVFVVLMIKNVPPKSVRYSLMLFGLLSVISSFYSDFNFSDFSKFALYLSFLNALLIYAVTLQRLQGVVNFYLAFSPAMLLMLSFFLHNSVGMLFYMVFVLFVFLLLFVWHKMDSSLYRATKTSLSIFAYSLPVVALLFVVFPRISFEKADYGFQDTLVKRSGHNGSMSLGSDALLVPSSQVIMEVYFREKPPQNEMLYFRGTTLYIDNNDSFRQLPSRLKHPLRPATKASVLTQPIAYDITLYAHNEKWLYALDIPSRAPQKSTLYEDYTLLKNKKIEKNYRYSMTSHLGYKMSAPLQPDIRKVALEVDKKRDPISAKIAEGLIAKSDSETLENLRHYFRSLGLIYTLKPEPLDAARPIDSFIQGTKKGYCVHFTAAFTYMARVAKLPTRVVTGFMLSSNEALEKYLVVREYAAHAWVEVYLEKEGWIRVDATNFASSLEQSALESRDPTKLSLSEKLLHYTNLRFMYVKYVIETWILEYSRLKQMEILDKLLHDSLYLLKFMGATLLLLLFSFVLAIVVSGERCRDKVICLMKPLLKQAKKKGCTKVTTESMHDYLIRLEKYYNRDYLVEISHLYHRMKYDKTVDKRDEQRLKYLMLHVKNNSLDK